MISPHQITLHIFVVWIWLSAQLVSNGGATSKLDVSNITVSITAKSSALANGYGSVVSDLLKNQEVSPTKALVSAGGGVLSGFVGGKVATQMTSKLDFIASSRTLASSISSTTRSSFVRQSSSAGISGITTGTDVGVNVGVKGITNPDKELPYEL